jgi:hypothetical protein
LELLQLSLISQLFISLSEKKITTPLIDLFSLETEEKTVTMSDVVCKLTGSPRLPTDIPSGLVIFDHQSLGTSHINTCAPSITFHPRKMTCYEMFKSEMLSLLFDDSGFGEK